MIVGAIRPQQYDHINALSGDGDNPGLLGMSKVVSDDSVRRSNSKLPEKKRSNLARFV